MEPNRPGATADRADLHTHTSASDGLLAPAQLVALAAQRGLGAIAITDHDTVDGYLQARELSDLRLRLVPGVELSCAVDGVDVHILGYGFDPLDTELVALLGQRSGQRLDRAAEIVERLQSLGVPVSMERVRAIAGSGTVGRPHIARALVEAGHVSTVGDAFARYLANGRPAYVERPVLTPERAIAALHRAAGVAVLAHPLYSPTYRDFLPALVESGLDGMEVHYPDHNDATRARLGALAERYGLIQTGGTDFHADFGRPGRALGDVTVPVAVIDRMAERAEGRSDA
ncbi:MAG TPA: PHP domain-containing protein [Thermomicrobiales bacterium]|jgi:hypothetical protein|nr:PHP domain-containing protein [Thermomicrobiales bacterium]